MEVTKGTISISMHFPLTPDVAFETFLDELAVALAQNNMSFTPGPNGRMSEGEFVVGTIMLWKPGELIQLQWHPADWQAEEVTNVAIRFEGEDEGTRVTVEQQGWGGLLGTPREVEGWFVSAVIAPFLQATAPHEFGNWLTDRRARQPSGAQARDVYRDPLYHYPNFGVILQELTLTPDDYLIEVGCGGGAMLAQALKSGCRAAGVDHSVEMVQLARQTNQDAIAENRLDIRQASADQLPFPDATFTCGAMTGVFGFLPYPRAALHELWRVLKPGGRLVVMGTNAALRGTPAAPEPIASRLRFYDDAEFLQLAQEAGFLQATVVRRSLEPFARQAGIPDEDMALFAGQDHGEPFLIARKD